MDESGILKPPQNPTPNTSNFIPFPYTCPQLLPPGTELPYAYVYNVDPLAPTSYYTPQGQFEINPHLPPAPQGITLPKAATQLHGNKNGKKGPKKAKIVQSEWCEVCKINCNSKDVLDNHKLGKKHKKNLEKVNNLTNAIPAPIVTSTSTPPTISNVQPVNNPIIGPQENPAKVPSSSSLKSKKKKLAATEDIESKRRKVVDGGAAAEAVRTCTYCNVVCNSDTVFNYHMAGQKHAATMKKYAAAMSGIAFVAG